MPRLTPEQRAAEHRERCQRDAQILQAWLDGERTQDIARRYGLSVHRVGQIIDIPRHEAERRARQEHRADRDAALVQAWSMANPGIPAAIGSQELQLPLPRVRALLAERLCLHQHPATSTTSPPRVTSTIRPRWSQEELLNWVQRYFQTPGPWSLAGLEHWLHQHDDAPSTSLIRSRIGRWPTLVAQCAGQPPSTTDPYPPTYTP